MAVQIVKKTCKCPNCREDLQFSRVDCSVIQKEEVYEDKESYFKNDDMYYRSVYYNRLVERWYVICPTCRNKFVGYSVVLKSEKINR